MPTFLGCSLFRSPGMKGCGLRQDISEKGDLLKKCFAGSSISEDGVKRRIFSQIQQGEYGNIWNVRGFFRNMWCCMVLSKNGDKDFKYDLLGYSISLYCCHCIRAIHRYIVSVALIDPILNPIAYLCLYWLFDSWVWGQNLKRHAEPRVEQLYTGNS